MTSDFISYADAGVNIEAGDRFVARIRTALRRTYSPRVIGKYGGFAGLFRLDYDERLFQQNYRQPVLVGCTDGVGTKVLLGIAAGRIRSLGIDLVAMSVNDLITVGADPSSSSITSASTSSIPTTPPPSSRASPTDAARPTAPCSAAKPPKCPTSTAKASSTWPASPSASSNAAASSTATTSSPATSWSASRPTASIPTASLSSESSSTSRPASPWTPTSTNSREPSPMAAASHRSS